MGATKKVAILGALLALGGTTAACDGEPATSDAGLDSGPGRVDSGPGEDAGSDAGTDGGMGDAGTDGGPPPAPYVRLAHLVNGITHAGAPSGAVHLCLQGPGTQLLITRSAAGMSTPIPYGGVSNYTNSLSLPPIPLTVHVYPAGLVTGTTCPDVSMALFSADVDASALVPGERHTIAAVGRAGATGDDAPKLVIIEDDLTEPAAGMTRVRIVHGVTRVLNPADGSRLNVDVCFDADGPTGTAAMGEAIATGASFVGSATDAITIDYLERAPMATGALLVYLRVTPTAIDCATPGRAPDIAFPIPFPIPTGAGIPANLTATVDADDVVTIFLRGDAALGATLPPACTGDAECTAVVPGSACHPTFMRCLHEHGPSVTPWIDDL